MCHEGEVSRYEETGCGEETFLAEDHSGGDTERDVDSGILPAAQAAGESVLLVAAQSQVGPAGTKDAGIELVLGDGRRLRISKGVDEQTLRGVLAAVEPSGC